MGDGMSTLSRRDRRKSQGGTALRGKFEYVSAPLLCEKVSGLEMWSVMFKITFHLVVS